MRHDYDLPPDWDAMTDAERSRWLTRDRARRQALRQGNAAAEAAERRRAERQRRQARRHGRIDVERNR